MTLKEHYRFHSRKSIKPFLKLITLFLLSIVIFYTYSRYAYTGDGNASISIAKWNIEINGEKITNQNKLNNSISLLNSKDKTTYIDEGDECYFDIIINPKMTEVAIFYTISIDLDESNLPTGTKFIKYEKYINAGDNEVLSNTEILDNYKLSIEENISLINSQKALDDTAIRRYRIYCKIPNLITVEKNNNYTVNPHITVEQFIK